MVYSCHVQRSRSEKSETHLEVWNAFKRSAGLKFEVFHVMYESLLVALTSETSRTINMTQINTFLNAWVDLLTQSKCFRAVAEKKLCRRYDSLGIDILQECFFGRYFWILCNLPLASSVRCTQWSWKSDPCKLSFCHFDTIIHYRYKLRPIRRKNSHFKKELRVFYVTQPTGYYSNHLWKSTNKSHQIVVKMIQDLGTETDVFEVPAKSESHQATPDWLGPWNLIHVPLCQ